MKKILIVGAASAIACACARRWAIEQSEFFLVARDESKLLQTCADLKARGASRVIPCVTDLGNIDAQGIMLEQCLAAMQSVDICLIAYGSLPNQHECERSVESAMAEFANNGSSVIALLTRLASLMIVQRSGTLAVISSVAGDRGRPSNYVYGAAKAAVSTFCEGLRARLFKSGVHVITIKPGFVDTPMTRGLAFPALLVAQPEAVAGRIVAGIERKVSVLYVPAFWALIMCLIRALPQSLFKRLNL
ncbi:MULTISPECIES: SDR family oxidoreductase [Pseudomonas]|uniref:SDR family oxidoreductase n=1 Tax=Pseudomonas TaxID=286 RepID=UPI001BE9C8F0|nr:MULTISPECIES: SDR family oxidoreductase [Pseudomonas]MBT2338539.1 SDR family oxidoreductase [Pseudomonas fluorescens]MCD4529466.1 SDR family oxidoreductase [Pseudomonas sp. C3-2018]